MKARFVTCLLLLVNVVFADPVVNPPDPWYVGQLIDVQGSGFEYLPPTHSIVITFSDESTFTDSSAPVSSQGNLTNTSTRIPVGSPGGTALLEVVRNGVVVASDTFEVIADPSLVVPDPLDVDTLFYVRGWGFDPYTDEDVYISVIQGEYRWEVTDEDPGVYGDISESFLAADDEFFEDEATFVAHLEDGTILATTTVEVVNGTGTEPVFTPEDIPDITVTTPSTFREGDLFDVELLDGSEDSAVTIQVIGDNDAVEYDYGTLNTDTDGEFYSLFRMPLVLSQSVAQDGRVIRVSHNGYTEDFPVTLHEGVRFGLSADVFEEGDTIDAEIRNGIGESQVIFQIVHDDVVVHEYGFTETDGSGYGEFELDIPTVLPPTSNEDGFVIRAIHAGVIIDKGVTIQDGLRVVTGQRNVREGHTLYVTVFNGTPSTSVTMAWWHDDTFVQNQSGSFATNGAGLGEFSFTVPDLIQTSADSDLYTLKVTHDGNTFELDITIHQAITPDPGDPLVAGLVNANHSNTIPANSMLGLARKLVAGATKAEIDAIVGSTIAGDPNFQKVLCVLAHSLVARYPLDGVDFGDLIVGPTTTNVAALVQQIIDNCSHTLFLKERTKHQLVILIHGRGGHNFDANSGLNFVYDDIAPHMPDNHVLRLESGTYFESSTAFDDGKAAVIARINDLALVSEDIYSVVIVGHSWGGGMAYEMANWINSYYSGSIEVSGLVYVDAIVRGSFVPLDAFPANVSSILNIYQSDFTLLEDLATGLPITNPGLGGFDGTAYYGRYRQIDVDKYGNQSSHTTIESDQRDTISGFVLHVLNEWYWYDYLY